MAAGAEGDSNLPTSHVGREQVLDALKAAFVQGRLAKDEFDLRVGQVLTAYAELDAVTADIPARLTTAQPPETIRKSHNKKLIQRGTAVGAGASMAFTAALVTVGGSPAVAWIAVPVVGTVIAVLLAGLLTLLSWVLEKGSSRRASQGPPADLSGKASQRLASADSAKPAPQTSHEPRHTAEAARSRYGHLRTSRAAVQGA